MQNYTLQFPGKIIFGNGSFTGLANIVPPASQVMIFCGRHFAADNGVRKLELLLPECKLSFISDVTPEPDLGAVEHGLQNVKTKQIDTVIAIGGGSVIDTAKTVAALSTQPGTVLDYFDGKRQITGRALRLIAVPTTAGTGAEITPNAVFINRGSGEKRSIKSPFMYADIAIVDPELTRECPPAITAACGFDALTQAVESFISKHANRPSQSLAAEAVRLLFNNLEGAVNSPTSANRSAMAEGSMLGAMAFSSSGLGAVHGIAHPLGSCCHIPHGICCAVLLIPILRWNLPACREQLTKLAIAVGVQSAEDFITALENLRQRTKIPATFSDWGLDKRHFPFIVQHCRSGSMRCNPREMSDDEVAAVLQTLL